VQTIKIDASNIKCDVPYLQQGKEGLGWAVRGKTEKQRCANY
jgi:hypothetical protein